MSVIFRDISRTDMKAVSEDAKRFVIIPESEKPKFGDLFLFRARDKDQIGYGWSFNFVLVRVNYISYSEVCTGFLEVGFKPVGTFFAASEKDAGTIAEALAAGAS